MAVKIREVELVNAFQHEKLKASFTNFHAIVGRNGSGKSNITAAIKYNLINTFDLPGTLDTMIRFGETKGAITLMLEHEGELVTSRSTLGANRRSLKRSDGEDIKSAKDVKDAIIDMIGMSEALINDVAIVDQGKLDAGLFDTHAKRMQFFMRLSGLSELERKSAILLDERTKHIIPMFSFNIEDIRRRMVDTNDQLLSLQSQHKANSLSLEDLTLYAELKDRISRVDAAAATARRSAELKQEIAKLAKVVDEVTSVMETQVASLHALRDKYEPLKLEVGPLISKLAAHTTAVEELNRKQKLLEGYQSKLRELGDEPPASDDTEIRETEKLLIETTVHCDRLRRAITALKDATGAQCPTCAEDLSDEKRMKLCADNTEELKQLLELKKAVESALVGMKEKHASAIQAQQAYAKSKSALEGQITTTQEGLAHTVIDETFDVAAAKARIAEKEEVEVQLLEIGKQVDEVREIQALARKELSTKEGEYAGIAGHEAGVSPDSVQKDRHTAAAFEQRIMETKKLEGRIEELQKNAEQLTKDLDDLERKHLILEKMQKYADTLEAARAAIHRDAFPAVKISAFIERALFRVNEYLDVMHAGFMVTYANEDGFVAHFPMGKMMRADRLSGGERVVFALAFRFAVNELYNSGFLILDEPTVFLDDEHLGYVIGALALVREHLVPATQVIIVTHEERVAAVCDGVLQVG